MNDNDKILEDFFLLAKACAAFLQTLICCDEKSEEYRNEYHLASQIYEKAEDKFSHRFLKRDLKSEEEIGRFYEDLRECKCLKEFGDKLAKW